MEDELGGTPKSVRALREFYKNRKKEIPSGDLLKELQSESDRAVIILMGTYLDDALIIAISKRLPNASKWPEVDEIFEYSGPLGAFSDRIKFAYALGVISDDVRSQLDDIREMRNACAHSKFFISFETPELAAVCHRILHPRGIFHRPDSPGGLRNIFIAETAVIYEALKSGSHEQAKKRVALVIQRAARK